MFVCIFLLGYFSAVDRTRTSGLDPEALLLYWETKFSLLYSSHLMLQLSLNFDFNKLRSFPSK